MRFDGSYNCVYANNEVAGKGACYDSYFRTSF